jgi:hypothetical protein
MILMAVSAGCSYRSKFTSKNIPHYEHARATTPDPPVMLLHPVFFDKAAEVHSRQR